MGNILQAKKTDTVRFSAKISPVVSADFNTLKERIKKEAPALSLDIDAVVERAVASAVKKANKELDQDKSSQPQVAPSTQYAQQSTGD